MKGKLIGADHFKNFVNLAGLKKCENQLLYTKTKTGTTDDEYHTDLCILDVTNNQTRQLTENVEVEQYQWCGEHSVIFTAVIDDEDKELQKKKIPITSFYLLDTQTKEIELLFKVHKKVSDFAKISDQQYFFLCSDLLCDDNYMVQAEGDLDRFSQIKMEEEDYFIAEEVPFWTNSAGPCNGKRGRLFLYEEGVLTQISPDDLHVQGMSAHKDVYVAYYGVQCGGVQNTMGKLYGYDIKEREITAIDDSEEYLYTYLDTVSEREILVCRSDRKLHGEYQDEYIDLMNIKEGTYTRKNQFGDYHIYDNVVTDVCYLSNLLNKLTRTEKGIYFIATEMESSKVFYWDDEKELPTPLTKTKGKLMDYELVGNTIYTIAMRGLGGAELYCMDPKTGQETRLTSYNTELEEIYKYAAVEPLPFINKNGVEIQGWYMKPVDFKEGEKYPTILFIHGGPQCAFGEVFNHDMQLMAANGYGAIFCNPTGSEGRGGEFADIRMKYGTIDYDDLTGFTKYAAHTLDWIDEKRLGITGGSYGGIMTNWIIGHTDIFNVAISDRGVCNNISDFGLSDIGVAFGADTFQASPWKNIEYLWETSPLKYAPNIKTPVLFIHGMEDYRCPYDSALQFHTALTFFGTPSKVVVFKGENHELCRSGQPKHRIRRFNEMVKWFDHYSK